MGAKLKLQGGPHLVRERPMLLVIVLVVLPIILHLNIIFQEKEQYCSQTPLQDSHNK